MIDIGLGTSLKIGAVVGVVAIVGLSYWHYTSLVGDLVEAESANAILQDQVTHVADVANRNAVAVARADADRRAAVEALEFVQSGLDLNAKTSRLAESAIDTTPSSQDGPIAGAVGFIVTASADFLSASFAAMNALDACVMPHSS